MERGVITEVTPTCPPYVLQPSPPITRPIGVTSHTTPLSNRRGAGGEACPVRSFLTYYAPPCGGQIAERLAVERRGDHLLSLASPVLSRNLSLLPT